MKRKLNASYTIEAAFILPLVFALLYGIIFLGFYLHDHTVIQQCAWEGAFYGAGQTDKISQGEIDAYIEEHLERRLLVSEITQITVRSDKAMVRVKVLGKAKVLGFSMRLLGYTQESRIQAERTAEYPCAAEYVRRGLIISEQLRGLWQKEEKED
ncbi:MAG: pilus assembly protein [Lachnospiraceae bacterium]|nr:pilus assembly protein [Lachnospiraceae bacterium]